MKANEFAIFGCGTVGGGVAQIVLELQEKLKERASTSICLKKIVELEPAKAFRAFFNTLSYFCGMAAAYLGRSKSAYR
jgi:homoserine dehydrogenase